MVTGMAIRRLIMVIHHIHIINFIYIEREPCRESAIGSLSYFQRVPWYQLELENRLSDQLIRPYFFFELRHVGDDHKFIGLIYFT